MRRFFVGSLTCGSHCSVKEVGCDAPDMNLVDLVDVYREHRQFCSSKRSWIPREAPKPPCCSAGCQKDACYGLTAVIGNASTLIKSMTVEHRCDTVPLALARKYVGEALALMTAVGNHCGAWEDPADVRLARATRVLSEFITLVDPPKEQP